MTDAPTPTADQLAAKRRDQVKGALGRYRFMANFTGVFLLILCAELIYKYVIAAIWDLPAPEWLWYIGAVHGWGYVIYLLFTLDLGMKVRWPAPRFLLTLLAGTIPFASFYFEKKNSDEIREQFDL
ncbi:hypothetical protein TPAU25S_00055 [Tsukamurella paurometabola]|uniref:DUF3817 domain-containing protein n=1 Tax=Tsukamurella paurometabola (strain ATCC 8368 / DSM 20162 / CCUG 35730 / CIP 100753 / JCM 10117 / KCTC 9821 / NBRC 16120 / NCIMB 702349 / NCTC 13040) TaxID=521096 RepID=D5UWQ8_TSUPD|nr:DUF3817 domain-containing protein [Tsukamurella paurometabola]ADG77930.1 conserved hypothetical protein [Tsukamurella paurometabola DSM 20162]SUP29405.1 integral membrane protein [Tsukamurella paurometabola]